jgi:hypothetical protein
MSLEERRKYKKKSQKDTNAKGKKNEKETHNPKKQYTPEELEARKRAQRLAMFDKKKNLFKK